MKPLGTRKMHEFDFYPKATRGRAKNDPETRDPESFDVHHRFTEDPEEMLESLDGCECTLCKELRRGNPNAD